MEDLLLATPLTAILLGAAFLAPRIASWLEARSDR